MAILARPVSDKSIRWPIWEPRSDMMKTPVDWRNGYALCTTEGLARIHAVLKAADATERERLRGLAHRPALGCGSD